MSKITIIRPKGAGRSRPRGHWQSRAGLDLFGLRRVFRNDWRRMLGQLLLTLTQPFFDRLAPLLGFPVADVLGLIGQDDIKLGHCAHAQSVAYPKTGRGMDGLRCKGAAGPYERH